MVSVKILGNQGENKNIEESNVEKESTELSSYESYETENNDSQFYDSLSAIWVDRSDSGVITVKLFGDQSYTEETKILSEVEDDVQPKCNFRSNRSPEPTDDVTEGYSPNSLWVDYSRDPAQVYRCIDNTEGEAVWVRIYVDVNLSQALLNEWLEENETTLHSHDNKNIIDAITNSGSGKIITDEERELLNNLDQGGFDLSNNTTDDLPEGTVNLYYKDYRVDNHLSGGTGIDYNNGTISIDTTVVQVTNTDTSNFNWVLDEDDFASNSNTKLATQQSIKSYVDSVSSTYGDSDVDEHLSGGTGIEYSLGVISIDSTVTQNTDTDVSENSWVLDENDFTSNSNTKVPTQNSVKEYINNFNIDCGSF